MMTKMLREHYNIIANALHKSMPKIDDEDVPKVIEIMKVCKWQWEYDIEQLADALIETNPRFDRERFIKACNTGV